MLIFEDSRVREFTPKIAPKSLTIWEKTCLEMLCFLVFVFLRFFLDFVSILAHFWSSKGHLGAFKIKSFSIMAPRWSLRGLRGASGVDFGSVLVRSWIALGAILASGFGYNVFFLHETQHGFHIRFSFSPCSAAVRAQHMESKRQGSFFMENPIFDELFI
jgi:hypothetical protein